jgi:spore maturation protein CgeB
MKILLGHTMGGNSALEASVENWIDRLKMAGNDVDEFSLVYQKNKPIVYWEDLDHLWRVGDRRLLDIYSALGATLNKYDAFICYNGSNVHPEIVRHFRTINVYSCFDDPESSARLSKPVAHAFDIAMVGNIAEIETYRLWGIQNVHWWPLGFRADDFDATLTEAQIVEERRDVDITLLCERNSAWRRARVDQVAMAFPQGIFRGPGWPTGFLPEKERIPLLRRTKIGVNIHNSTGPINFRTYYLPANGVMMVCDNKSFLGKIFELGKEAVGFDTIPEAIELVRYYLKHDDQRREIAAAGWKRAVRDYNEVAVFRRMVDAIATVKRNPKPETEIAEVISAHRHNTRLRRSLNYAFPLHYVNQQGIRAVRGIQRAISRRIANSKLGGG